MTKTHKLVFTALCAAMGLLLPMAFHSVPRGGAIFLPMHIPVLLCGLIAGPQFGLICGAITPLLSSLLTGMPSAAILPPMLCELAVYGFATGFLMNRANTKWPLANLYLSLVGAMLLGRVVSGLLKALIFNVGAYSMEVWVAASFVTALPGIAIQLVMIPAVMETLRKARILTWA